MTTETRSSQIMQSETMTNQSMNNPTNPTATHRGVGSRGSVLLALALGLVVFACSEGGKQAAAHKRPAPAEPFSIYTESHPKTWEPYVNMSQARDALNTEVGSLIYKLEELPKEGNTQVFPWPSSWWPTYLDSVNHKWDPSQPSATAKYAAATGQDPKELEDAVSLEYGIDSHKGETCTTDADCSDSKGLRMQCGRRTGADEGVCIPWFEGICGGWAAAAFMVDMVEGPVVFSTADGVATEFDTNDLKGLASLLYYEASGDVYLGARCDFAVEDIPRDPYGRPDDENCRAMDPGAFHVVLTNFVGIHGQSIVDQRTFALEIWNQPVYAYRVTSMTDVTAAEANALVDPELEGWIEYQFNDDATHFVAVDLDLRWVPEVEPMPANANNVEVGANTHLDKYSYVLELDSDGNIIGGEWTGASIWNHPAFLYMPTAPLKDSASAAGIQWSVLKEILKAPKAQPDVPVTASPSEAMATGDATALAQDAVGTGDSTGVVATGDAPAVVVAADSTAVTTVPAGVANELVTSLISDIVSGIVTASAPSEATDT